MNRVAIKYSVVALMLVCSVLLQDVSGQRWKLRRYEIGIGIGSMQIFGDIGGTADESNLFGLKDIKVDETSFSFGGLVRYKINPFFSFKTSFNYGRGQGTDLNSSNDRGRSYESTLFEFSAIGEYFFLVEDKRYRSSAIYNRRGMINNFNTFSSYLFAGIGFGLSISEHANAEYLPQDDYRSGRNMFPLVPFGVGARYVIDDRLLINGDFGYRVAISDYVEGYTQAWSSKSPDIYYFLNISLNYRLKNSKRNIPLFMDRRYK